MPGPRQLKRAFQGGGPPTVSCDKPSSSDSDRTSLRAKFSEKRHVRGSRLCPPRHDKLTLTVGADAHDRRHKDPRQQRQISCAIVRRAKPIADRGLTFCRAVEVAHSGDGYAAKTRRPQNSFLSCSQSRSALSCPRARRRQTHARRPFRHCRRACLCAALRRPQARSQR